MLQRKRESLQTDIIQLIMILLALKTKKKKKQSAHGPKPLSEKRAVTKLFTFFKIIIKENTRLSRKNLI